MASQDDEDVRLMCRVREDDLEAFAALLARHRQRVESFLTRLLRSREKAEDGAQEVFLRLWMARHRYQEQARFTTFLYQIAHNYWIDQVRKASVRPTEVVMPEDNAPGSLPPLAPAYTEPQHHLIQRYEQWRIQEAIARLPEIYRAVFVLAHLEGAKIAEIAQILGIPEGTVKSRLHTAVRMLRRWLTAEEESER